MWALAYFTALIIIVNSYILIKILARNTEKMKNKITMPETGRIDIFKNIISCMEDRIMLVDSDSSKI